MQFLSESKEELERTRNLLSDRLRNYTCEDDSMMSSEPLKTTDHVVFGRRYQVNTYLDMPSAKIWTVPNFVTPAECHHLMTYGKPKLRRATVAAEDGTSIVSENRKANQAAYAFSPERQKMCY